AQRRSRLGRRGPERFHEVISGRRPLRQSSFALPFVLWHDTVSPVVLREIGQRPRGRMNSRIGRTACLVFVILAAAPARLQADDRADPPQAGASAANAIAPLSADAKLSFYLKSAYGPASVFRSFASAGVSQAQDYPTEWGQG